jgi:hypothetical protein
MQAWESQDGFADRAHLTFLHLELIPRTDVVRISLRCAMFASMAADVMLNMFAKCGVRKR